MNKRLAQNILVICVILFISLIYIFSSTTFQNFKAKDIDDCLICHEDEELTMKVDGKEISIYVNPVVYKNSVHGLIECTGCHVNYNPDESPHTPTKVSVNCVNCHDDSKLKNSSHKEVECKSCHSNHNVEPAKEHLKDQTKYCLGCHSNINVRSFKKSIHDRNGVKCADCHKSGHTTINISKGKETNSCGKCHNRNKMELGNSVHKTVLRKDRKKTPSCVDCHGSHKIVSSKMSIESQSCLKCHLDEKLFPGNRKGSAKFVSQYKTSIHSSIQKDGKPVAGCIDCHGNHMIENADDPSSSLSREKMFETCSKCHSKVVESFAKSSHGIAFKSNLKNAPSCTDCHGEHSIKSVLSTDELSKINQTEPCLDCHRVLEPKLTLFKLSSKKDVHFNDYEKSFHYLALKNGNTNAASCSDCHGTHEMKDTDDPLSKINPKNIGKTCGSSGCHVKEFSEYNGSIHQVSFDTREKSDAPNCVTCHGNHQIIEKDDENNQLSNSKGIVKLCLDCHANYELIEEYNFPIGLTEAYDKSFHGLAIKGGSTVAADCGSCHSNHNIRPSSDSLSTIHFNNIAETCGDCHPGASEVIMNSPIHVFEASTQFPLLYWVRNFYIILIILTISFMFLHNVLHLKRKFKKAK